MRWRTPKEVRPVLIGMLIGVGFLYVTEALYLLLGWIFAGDVNLLRMDRKMGDGLARVQWIGQLVVALFGGLIRAAQHPALDLQYSLFLKTTPWDASKPLPKGAAHLRGFDWLLLAAWTGIVFEQLGEWALYVPVIFLFGYFVSSLFVHGKTGEEGVTLVLAFGLAGIVRLWDRPAECLGLAVALYGVNYLGLMRGLAKFPWEEEEKPVVAQFGWPLGQVGPKRKEVEISFRSAVVVALLVAWWIHACLSHVTRGAEFQGPATVMLAAAMGVFAGLIRLAVYVTGYASPVSLKGRIATGRLIIPSHDSAWWSALLLPLIAGATQFLVGQYLPAMYSVPATIFVVLLSALTLPPSRRRYQLTGEHRILEPRRINMEPDARPA
jgi:hypothetical protein